MTKPGKPDAPAPDAAAEGHDAGSGGEAPTRVKFADRLQEIMETDDDALEQQVRERAAPFAGDDADADELEEGDDAEGLSVGEEGEDDGGEEGEREPGDEADPAGERDVDDDGEGDEDGEGDPEVDDDEEGAGEELEGYVVLDLPARHEGDPDFQLPINVAELEELGIDAEDAVQRVNQLRNGYAYRREAEEIVTQVQEDRDELDLMYEALSADPTGFLVKNVDPKVRSSVVEQLILELDDDSFEALTQRVTQLARNPQSRDTARTKAENERLTSERDTERAQRVAREVKKQLREINGAIRGLIPETMNPRLAGAFRAEAAAELQQHVKENNLQSLDPAEVSAILADRGVLEAFDVPLNGGRPSGSDDPPRKKKRASADTAQDRPAGDKKKPDVRERLKRRKSAASTPAGAGSAAPAGFKKVPGERHDDKMSRLRRHLGLRQKKS